MDAQVKKARRWENKREQSANIFLLIGAEWSHVHLYSPLEERSENQFRNASVSKGLQITVRKHIIQEKTLGGPFGLCRTFASDVKSASLFKLRCYPLLHYLFGQVTALS